MKKTNQRKILNDFFLRRRRMDIFTKVSSLGRKLIYFFDFLLTTLFFRFKKFLTALVRIFRRRMIYREPYPTKADPIWCIRRRLPTPPHHRIHGAAEKNSTNRFSSSFFCSSSSSNRQFSSVNFFFTRPIPTRLFYNGRVVRVCRRRVSRSLCAPPRRLIPHRRLSPAAIRFWPRRFRRQGRDHLASNFL